tara:strand:- start:278 stop:1753 length:1476 start_codon:yes stop_codon:yes gene_type:complete
MSIKKYYATADNTITNAAGINVKTRGTGSNMGSSDILEVFSIYGQQTTSSAELSRVLVKFPTTSISSDRTAGSIPKSGSVNFILKLYNAEHPNTVPANSQMSILAVSRSWTEGTGLDMEDYEDTGVSNWVSSSTGTPWTTQGGDYHASPSYNKTLDTGLENIEVDVTSLVEEWIAGTKENNGFGVKFPPAYEAYLSNSSGLNSGSHIHNTSGARRTYYTKKFFGRGTQFFYKRPTIEARWDSSKKDRRNSFYASSSLVPSSDNLNTLYIYNRVRGQLRDIPMVGTGSIYASLYLTGTSGPVGTPLTLHNSSTSIAGGHVSTGIYSASLAVDTTSSYLYDVWHNNSGTQYITGSKMTILSYDADVQVGVGDYVSNITNLKPSYNNRELARLRLFVRDRDWNPTIYTVATTNVQSKVVEDAYWKIYRVMDNETIIDYGTGSLNHTRMSYDRDGNYFDVDMSMLETGYSYALKFVYKINDRFDEQSEVFKFRVD